MRVSLLAVAAILTIGSAPLLADNIPYANVGTGFKPLSGSDVDHNDDTFTNIAATVPTPEPGRIALLGTGLLGLAGALRRKFTR